MDSKANHDSENRSGESCQGAFVDAGLDVPETVVRPVGVEPTRAVKPCGFSCRLRLSPPGRDGLERAPGLRSGLSLHPPPVDPGLRCCPSSLYTFPAGVLVRAWLGIAISGFPDFEQFCIAGFPGEHSSFP